MHFICFVRCFCFVDTIPDLDFYFIVMTKEIPYRILCYNIKIFIYIVIAGLLCGLTGTRVTHSRFSCLLVQLEIVSTFCWLQSNLSWLNRCFADFFSIQSFAELRIRLHIAPSTMTLSIIWIEWWIFSTLTADFFFFYIWNQCQSLFNEISQNYNSANRDSIDQLNTMIINNWNWMNIVSIVVVITKFSIEIGMVSDLILNQV